MPLKYFYIHLYLKRETVCFCLSFISKIIAFFQEGISVFYYYYYLKKNKQQYIYWNQSFFYLEEYRNILIYEGSEVMSLLESEVISDMFKLCSYMTYFTY